MIAKGVKKTFSAETDLVVEMFSGLDSSISSAFSAKGGARKVFFHFNISKKCLLAEFLA